MVVGFYNFYENQENILKRSGYFRSKLIKLKQILLFLWVFVFLIRFYFYKEYIL